MIWDNSFQLFVMSTNLKFEQNGINLYHAETFAFIDATNGQTFFKSHLYFHWLRNIHNLLI